MECDKHLLMQTQRPCCVSWDCGTSRRIMSEIDESEVLPYFGNSEDYLDVRGFQEFLENLAETDGSRSSGAPPTVVSFVNSLPRIAITEDHEKHDGLVCAICKESLSIGTNANQLPCFHLYHPPCIQPCLAERNSCPLCRYEFPTDDKDYEEGKMMNSTVPEITQGDYSGDDDSSDEGIIVNSPCLEKRPPPSTLALPLVTRPQTRTRNQTRAMNSGLSVEGRMVHSLSSSLCYRVWKPHCNSHPNQNNNRSSSKKKPSPPSTLRAGGGAIYDYTVV